MDEPIELAALTPNQRRLVRALVDVLRELRSIKEPEPVRLLSIMQAAARLGVGRTTVYHLIDSGRLRTLKVGSRRLVPEDTLDDFTSRG